MAFLETLSSLVKEFKDIILSKRIFVISFFVAISCLIVYSLRNTPQFGALVSNEHYNLIWLGFIFSSLLTISGIAFYTFTYTFNLLQNKHRKRKLNKARNNHIATLTKEESAILNMFISRASRTIVLPESKYTISLEEKNLIKRFHSPLGKSRFQGETYFIEDWAFRLLIKDPSLITSKVD